jgi:hypothetical protein
MKKRLAIVIALLTTPTTAVADSAFTDLRPAYGCYKVNGDDRCALTTYIRCAQSTDENVRNHGPVIATFCDALSYDAKVIEDLAQKSDRLEQRLRRLRRHR